MKTMDKFLELTNYDDDLVADIMLEVETLIYDEILDIDAITKWYEIEQATKEGREIQYIAYEPTDVPKMIIEDLNFDKAVRRKCEQMTTTIFDEMESETFNKWVFDISILMDIAKRKRI